LSGENFDPKVKTNGEDAKMKNAQGDRIVNPKNFEIDPNEDQQNIVDLDFDLDKAQSEECNGLSSVLGAGRQVGEHHNPGGGVRLTRLDGRRHDHSGQPAEDLHQRLTIDDMEANLAEDLTCDVNAVGATRFGGRDEDDMGFRSRQEHLCAEACAGAQAR
jgi:hypothetical protein